MNMMNIHNSNAIFIGIVPFISIEKNIEPIDEIIKSDLQNSGKFIVVDRYNLPQYPKSIKEIFSSSWNKQNINFVLIGESKLNNTNNYNILYKLIAINKIEKKILLENSFIIQKKWMRYAAHTISNEVFEKLTGIKGSFRSRIVYAAKIKNNNIPYELRISDYDGFNSFVIRKSKYPLMHPTWSPDGNSIAYVEFENEKSSLVIQELDSGNIKNITSFTKHNGAPAFSPDGSKIACVLSRNGSLNIYIINLNSKNIKFLTNENSNNTEPRWFSDNKSIAYTSDQTGIPQIYKKKEDEVNFIERLSWNRLYNQDVDVSSDSEFLVMINTINNKQNIVKYNMKSEFSQKLTDTFLDEHPRLSFNDNIVVYNTYQGQNSIINLVSINGRSKRCILKSDNESFTFPSWSPLFIILLILC